MTLPSLEFQLLREYYERRRQALLMEVDALERLLCIEPRTAEIRKKLKERFSSDIEQHTKSET